MPEIVAERFLGATSGRLTVAGGAAISQPPRLAAVRGQTMMAVKLALDAGFFHPWHNHPDHESMGVVLQGRLQMRIADQTLDLGPGDVWHHPKGVYHETRALEPTLVVEFHTPLRADLLAVLDA